MSKIVLIISTFFPPYAGAGSLRLGKFAKYLPHYGWQPLVLTAERQSWNTDNTPVEIDEIGIFRIPLDSWNITAANKISVKNDIQQKSSSLKPIFYRAIQKTVRLFRPIYSSPEFQLLFLNNNQWESKAFKKGLDIISKHSPEAIFSSTSHTLAAKLAKTTGIPWIAEYRDLWSLNPYSRKIFPFQQWEESLERRTMKHAASIIAISPGMADILEEFHKRNVAVITNGFDEDDFDVSVPLIKKFTLTIVGLITSPARLKTPFFEAIGQLNKERIISADDFELRFIGTDIQAQTKALVMKYGLEQLTAFYDWMPHEEIVKRLKESTVLFSLLDYDNPLETSICPGKVYEYFGAGRPVIGVFSEKADISQILKETGCGVVVNSLDQIKNLISLWVSEYKQRGDIISYYSPDSTIIKHYTHRLLAGRLAEKLERAINT